MASLRCRTMRRMLGLRRVSQSVAAASSASVMSSGSRGADRTGGAQHQVRLLCLDDHAPPMPGVDEHIPRIRSRWRPGPGRTRPGAATSSRGSPAARRGPASRSMVRAIGVQLLRRRSISRQVDEVREARGVVGGDPAAIADDHVRLDRPAADRPRRPRRRRSGASPGPATPASAASARRTPGSQWSGDVISSRS